MSWLFSISLYEPDDIEPPPSEDIEDVEEVMNIELVDDGLRRSMPFWAVSAM